MYLAFDTETGGLGDEVSLLTAYFTILDKDLNIIKELDLKLKPNDGLYKVMGEALGINKINLEKHDKGAITYGKGGTLLYEFLDSYYSEFITPKHGVPITYIDHGKLCSNGIEPITYEKLIPVGHNIAMDVRKVKQCLVSGANWDKYVSYRCMDTCAISQFLRLNGKLPKELSCSLDSLVKYFDLKVDGVIHEAKYDTLCTIEVLKKLNNSLLSTNVLL